MRINEDYLEEEKQEYTELLPEFVEFLENASEETLNRIYDDYSWCKLIHRGGNILQEDLETKRYIYEEEYPKSLHPDVVCKNIKQMYPLEVDQVQIVPGSNTVRVIYLIAAVKNNADMIIKDMNHCGWFPSQQVVTDIIRGRKWMQMIFEPYYPDDAMNDVKKNDILIHVTPKKNIPEIQKYGLVPKAENKKFSYPPRVHFFSGQCSTGFIHHAIFELSLVSKLKIEDYMIVIVDVWKISNDVKFYHDADYELAMFTYDTIPPDAIESYLTYS